MTVVKIDVIGHLTVLRKAFFPYLCFPPSEKFAGNG